MIRIVIADDETLVRQGIRRLLEADGDIEVVGEARDGQEALKLIRQTAPDVVLLDVRMPGMDGIQVLDALQASSDSPPCLLLTTFDDGEAFLEGVRAGARGYLRKDAPLAQLREAIHILARGETFLQPALTAGVLHGFRSARLGSIPEASPVFQEPLTGREQEVLRLMAGGYSNREIASALGTAEATAKVHVSSILSKLGVRDRTRAVLRALEWGLLSGE
jgi:DNA-binding NarL/FixJ family response regulator